jgi:membrane fusion protein, multidrug efflux system
MKKRMLWMLAGVVAFIAIIGFIKFQQIQAAIAGGKAYSPPPEAVTTIVTTQQQWQTTIDAVGSVAPVQGVMLSADQPGVVDKIDFESGSHVKAGQVLVALDTKQERAQLEAAEAQRELAKISLDRGTKLVQSQSISQADFDQISAQFKQADAAVIGYEAAIARKTIRAPFDGVAGIRQVNLGQYLRSGDPVVPVQSVDPVYVNFSVPQQQVAAIRVGAEVRAAADSGAHAVYLGRVTAINPMADDATRNVQVQATFHDPRGTLRPGMYVTVTVELGTRLPVVALPSSAISFAPYGNSVFIVEDLKGPTGKSYRGVRQQFVKLGAARGDQVSVLDGIKPGQEIVTSGVFKLRTGAAVLVNNKVQPGNSLTPKPQDS